MKTSNPGLQYCRGRVGKKNTQQKYSFHSITIHIQIYIYYVAKMYSDISKKIGKNIAWMIKIQLPD